MRSFWHTSMPVETHTTWALCLVNTHVCVMHVQGPTSTLRDCQSNPSIGMYISSTKSLGVHAHLMKFTCNSTVVLRTACSRACPSIYAYLDSVTRTSSMQWCLRCIINMTPQCPFFFSDLSQLLTCIFVSPNTPLNMDKQKAHISKLNPSKTLTSI